MGKSVILFPVVPFNIGQRQARGSILIKKSGTILILLLD
jgi:hypothetical protein